jgi:hypothetical protein
MRRAPSTAELIRCAARAQVDPKIVEKLVELHLAEQTRRRQCPLRDVANGLLSAGRAVRSLFRRCGTRMPWRLPSDRGKA